VIAGIIIAPASRLAGNPDRKARSSERAFCVLGTISILEVNEATGFRVRREEIGLPAISATQLTFHWSFRPDN